MKKLFRIILGLVVLVVIMAAAGVGYLYAAYPKASAASALTVESTQIGRAHV